MQLEVAREETVQILCQQFAQDRLSTAELESRLEQVYKAQSLAELYALTSGLAPVALTTTEATLYAMAEPGTAVRAERRIPVIFSETTLDGDWELARRTEVVAVFGAAVLDLRERAQRARDDGRGEDHRPAGHPRRMPRACVPRDLRRQTIGLRRGRRGRADAPRERPRVHG